MKYFDRVLSKSLSNKETGREVLLRAASFTFHSVIVGSRMRRGNSNFGSSTKRIQVCYCMRDKALTRTQYKWNGYLKRVVASSKETSRKGKLGGGVGFLTVAQLGLSTKFKSGTIYDIPAADGSFEGVIITEVCLRRCYPLLL